MRDKALLGLMAVLAGMGVLVDFTSIFLSMLADLLMMAAAVACAVLVYRHQQAKIDKLDEEVKLLRVADARQRTIGLPVEEVRSAEARADSYGRRW